MSTEASVGRATQAPEYLAVGHGGLGPGGELARKITGERPARIRPADSQVEVRLFLAPPSSEVVYGDASLDELQAAERRLREQVALLKAATFMADLVEVAVPPNRSSHWRVLRTAWIPSKYRSARPIDAALEEASKLVGIWEGPIFKTSLLRRAFKLVPQAMPATEPMVASDPESLLKLLRWYAPAKFNPADFWDRPVNSLIPQNVLRTLDMELDPDLTVDQILDLSEMIHTPAGLALTDFESEKEIDSALRAGWHRSTNDPEPLGGQLCSALAVSHGYVLRAVPGLVELPLDLILEWRDELTDSLTSFSSLVRDLSIASTDVAGRDAGRALASLSPRLDQEYLDLEREARSTSLWRVTRDRYPTIIGTSAGLALSFGVGTQNIAVGATTLASATLSQCVAIALDAFQQRREIRSNPLYWRFETQRRLNPYT